MNYNAISKLFNHRGIPHWNDKHIGMGSNACALYKRLYAELEAFASEELQIGEETVFDVNRIKKLDDFDRMADTLTAFYVHQPFTEAQAEILLQIDYPLSEIADMSAEEQEDIPLYLQWFAKNVCELSLAKQIYDKAKFELDRYVAVYSKQPVDHILKTCSTYTMMVQALYAIYSDICADAPWLKNEAALLELRKQPGLLSRIVSDWSSQPTALNDELMNTMMAYGKAISHVQEGC